MTKYSTAHTHTHMHIHTHTHNKIKPRKTVKTIHKFV